MLLEKPAFSPLLVLDEAEKKVSSLLKKRNWADYSFSSVIHSASHEHSHGALCFVPYWFFSFDIYTHDSGKTTLVKSGFSALNAHSNKFDRAIAELELSSSKKIKNVHERASTKVLEPKVSDAEAREIIPVRLASEYKTSKENVIVSGLELLLAPFWTIAVEIEGKPISLQVNAVNGAVIGGDAIPFREKSSIELANELLKELSTPAGWVHYSTGLLGAIPKNFFNMHFGGHKTQGLSNDDLVVLLLAAIAIALILLAIYSA